ncbi:MAG: phosphatase PAP2 family protein [Croceicoccus sp.]|nr:phosphatase PAP2 family protein [Croceicoccus sp.]MAL25033.1 phosphatase PAP2 family protein [Croceicoccus sp.]|tara:strand:+ start:38669 stop:39292 length:624 start_codon:yes stop_codon:yes gene_type:complete
MHRSDAPAIPVFTAMLALIWLAALSLGGAGFDPWLIARLHPGRPDGWVTAAWVLTWLGDWAVLVPLGLGGVGWLVWQGRRRDAAVLVLALAAVRVLVGVQKHLIGRVRPDVTHYMTETSFSFPSGHSANAAATYLALALFLTRSRVARALAVLLVLAVGLSRVALGVHWPSDVIGGWAFGSFAALLAAQAQGRVRPSAANGESGHSG